MKTSHYLKSAASYVAALVCIPTGSLLAQANPQQISTINLTPSSMEAIALQNELKATTVYYLGSQADADALKTKFKATVITPSQLEALGTRSQIIIMADSRYVKDWKPLVKQIKAGNYVVAIGDTKPVKVLLSGSYSVPMSQDIDAEGKISNDSAYGYYQSANKGDFEFFSSEKDPIKDAEAAYKWALEKLAEQSQLSRKALKSTPVTAAVPAKGEWHQKHEEFLTVPTTGGTAPYNVSKGSFNIRTHFDKLTETDPNNDYWVVQMVVQSVPAILIYEGQNCYFQTRDIKCGLERLVPTGVGPFLNSYGPYTSTEMATNGWKVGAGVKDNGEWSLSLEYNHSFSSSTAVVLDNTNYATNNCSWTLNITKGSLMALNTSSFEPNGVYKIGQGVDPRRVLRRRYSVTYGMDWVRTTWFYERTKSGL